jgi:drug/metabolite transporter (DMT)-like permease
MQAPPLRPFGCASSRTKRALQALLLMKLTPRLALLLTLPPLMWAANAVVGRLMVGQVPPLTLNALRWALAALLLLPLGWRVFRQPALIRERLGWLLPVSLLGVGLYNALQYLALVTSTPMNVTLLASSVPVWMLAVGTVFFGERARPRQLLAAAVGLCGVLTVITRGSLQSLREVQFVAGDGYVIAAAIGWAFYSWLLARPPASMQGDRRPGAAQGWDWAGVLLLQSVTGGAMAAVFSAAELALTPAAVHWSPSAVAALVFVALGPAVLAYRCWGLGVAEAGPAMAAFFGNLTPLFAALMSVAVLGEQPQPFHAVAFALIVASIAINSGLIPWRRPPRKS